MIHMPSRRGLQLLLVLVVGLSTTSARAQECLGPFLDDFEDGVIDPSYSTWTTSCGSLSESGGEMLLVQIGGCGPGSIGATATGSNRVCGDFVISIDFDYDAPFVGPGIRSFTLRVVPVGDPDGMVSIQHKDFASSRRFETGLGPGFAGYTWASTAVTSGSLRISRFGSSVEVAYRAPGEHWTPFHVFPVVGDLDADIEFYSYKDQGASSFTAKVDNLRVDKSPRIVEWPISEGGNGHWYEVRVFPGFSDTGFTALEASFAARRAGGYLATLTSAEENQFVAALSWETPGAWKTGVVPPTFPLTTSCIGPWIGALQYRGSSTVADADPLAEWKWVSGEPWSFSAWAAGQPDDGGTTSHLGKEHYAHFWSPLADGLGAQWNDNTDVASLPAIVIEYDRRPEPLVVNIMPGYPNAPDLDPGERHKARPGRSTLIWGNANQGDGTALGHTYAFEFTENANVTVSHDGELSGVVTDDRDIVEEVTFTLEGGSTSEVVRVTLTVSGELGTDSKFVELIIVSDADQLSDDPIESQRIDADIAVEEALRALYLRQRADGTWAWPGDQFEPGSTGCVLWAFGNHGHTSALDPQDSIYAETVRLGIDGITQKFDIIAVDAAPWALVEYGAVLDGISDMNANGRALGVAGLAMASTENAAFAACALLASARPDEVIWTGRLAGSTYGEVVEDLLDLLGRHITFGPAVTTVNKGGYGYGQFYGPDQCNAEGAWVAIRGAEEVFDIYVPDWMKRPHEYFLVASQESNGRFTYTDITTAFVPNPAQYPDIPQIADNHSQGTTGCGLIGLAVLATQRGPEHPDGAVPGDIISSLPEAGDLNTIAAKRDAAIAYLGDRFDVDVYYGAWAEGHRDNNFAMWTVGRGLRDWAGLLGRSSNILLENEGVTFDWETGQEYDTDGTTPIGVAAPESPREGYLSWLTRKQISTGVDRGLWNPLGDDLSDPFLHKDIDTALGVLTLTPFVFSSFTHEAPVCSAGGPYIVECSGGTASVPLIGVLSHDPENQPLTYMWEIADCPGAVIDDPTAVTTTLTIPTNALLTCTVSLTVNDGEFSSTCETTIDVIHHRPPTLSVTVDRQSAPFGIYVRADSNDDGLVDIADPITTLSYLFMSGSLNCLDAGDANGDQLLDIADPIYTLSYLFASGPDPVAPFPDCGQAPIVLGCDSFLSCDFVAGALTEVSAQFDASDACGDVITEAVIDIGCEQFAYVAGDSLTLNCGAGECGMTPGTASPGSSTLVSAATVVLTVTSTDSANNATTSAVDLCEDNQPPLFTSQPLTFTGVDMLWEYTANATDADSDTLEYSLLLAPTGMSIDSATGLASWLPTGSDLGVHDITVRATDGATGIATQSFRVLVRVEPDYNLPPVFTSLPLIVGAEGTVYEYDVDATDPDSDPVSYALDSAPAGMTIDDVTGLVTWEPLSTDAGPHWIVVQANDDHGHTTDQGYLLVIDDALNRLPQITSVAPTTATEGEFYGYPATATDPDGDTLLWSLTEAPVGMNVVAATGVVAWTPAGWQSGTHNVVLLVDDSRGGTASESFTITVLDALDGPPIFQPPLPESLAATEGVPMVYDVDAYESEGQDVSFALLDSPTGLTIDSDGLLAWTPSATQAGPHNVTIQLSDPGGHTTDGSLTIVVAEALNSPPQIVSVPPFNAEVGQLYSYAIVVEDSDSTTFTYEIVEGPVGATVSATGLLEWTPSEVGVAPVTVRVVDDGGLDAEQFFAISITETLDITPPEVLVTATPAIVSIGETVTVTVVVTDESALVSVDVTVNGLPLTLEPDGTAEYVPLTSGLFVVEAIAVDDGGIENEGTVEFRVRSAVDDGAPIVEWTTPATETIVDGPVDVIGTANDTDLVFYAIEVSTDGGTTFAPYRRGFVPVVADILGRVQPGDLLPGITLFRICAEDSWGNQSCTVPVELDLGPANVSPGYNRFVLLDGFVDVVGIPLSIRRIYDARQRAPGDFGYNWSLESTPTRLETTRVMGADWTQGVDSSDPLVPVYFITSSVEHRVSVYLPDGSVHRFEMTVSDQQALFPLEVIDSVEFVALPGTFSQLQPSSLPLFVSPSSPGPVELVDGSFQPYVPNAYTLTLRDGRELIFTRDFSSGEYPLTRVSEPNGAFVDVMADGLVHSSGASLSLERDLEDRITSLTTPTGATRTYVYDAAGDLVSATDFEGYTTQYVYDGDHNLMQIVDPRGFTPGTLLYDDRGRIIGVVDSAGEQITLALDEVANQHIVTDRLGNTSVISYDDRGNVVAVLDPDLNETTFTFDSEDRLLSETNPLGHTRSYEYDPTGLLTTYTDPLGGEIIYTYDSSGHPLSTTDQLGRTTTFEYDAAGNQTAVEGPAGARVDRTFDGDGRVVQVEGPLGAIFSWDRDPLDSSSTTFTDSAGRTTLFKTNERGQVIEESYMKDGELAVFSHEIDDNGLTRSSTLPSGAIGSVVLGAGGYPAFAVDYSGAIQTVTFDAAGDLSAIAAPGTPVTTFERDVEGQVTRVENSEGRAVERSLDSQGRPTSLLTPSGRSGALLFDAGGRMIQETLSGNAPIDYAYDVLGRVVSSTTTHDTLGPVTATFEYDSASQLTAEVNELGERAEFAYDLAGNVTLLTFPDGTTVSTTYDLSGQPTTIVNELGASTNLAYDVGGRLASTSSAILGVTAYTYDEIGRLETATTPGGSVWELTSDRMGRISSQTYPWGGTRSWQRGPVGRILSVDTPTGQSIAREYDDAGRLAALLPTGGFPESYTYNSSGNLTSVVDGSGVTNFIWGPNGSVSRTEHPSGDAVEYDYDEHGRLVALMSPGGATSYEYDGQGRLASVIDAAVGTTDYEYDAAGRLASTHHADGSTTSLGRDLRGRVTSLVTTDASSSVIRNENYAYDAAGNVLSVTGTTTSVTYGYDAASRVISESWTGLPEIGSQSYTYDADWSLTTAGSRTFTYDGAQRLTSDGEFTFYLYDPAGRPIERANTDTTELLEYDAFGRLFRVERNDGGGTTVVELEYDFLSLLREIRVDGVVARTLLWETQTSDIPRLLEERAGDGTLLRRYVHGLRPVGIESSVNVVLHQDPLGSTRMITNALGVPVETHAFDAYGESATPPGSTTSLLFAGELYVPELDLYFLRSRFYDPTAGRFLTPDEEPVDPARPTSFTPYVYAAANPIRFTDPLGTLSLGEVNISSVISQTLTGTALPQLPLPVEIIARGIISDLNSRIAVLQRVVGASVGIGAKQGGFLGGFATVGVGLSFNFKRGSRTNLLEVNLDLGIGISRPSSDRSPKSRGTVEVQAGVLLGGGTGSPTPSSRGFGWNLKIGASSARFLFSNPGSLSGFFKKVGGGAEISIPLASPACNSDNFCESFSVSVGASAERFAGLQDLESLTQSGFDLSKLFGGESGPEVSLFGFGASMNLFWAQFGPRGVTKVGGFFDWMSQPADVPWREGL